MSRKLHIALLSLLVSAPSMAEGPVTSVLPLVVTNPAFQYEVGTFPDKSIWQSLECDKFACEVRTAKVKVDKYGVEHLGDAKAPVISLKPRLEAYALFPKSTFKLGKVETWYKAHTPNLESYVVRGESPFKKLDGKQMWKVPGGRHQTSLMGTHVVEKYPDGDGYSVNYELRSGSKRQTLFSIKEEAPDSLETLPIVHWAGDLDRDGKVDLILSIPSLNCGYDARLYLSSKAGPNEIVKLAAQLVGYQAACGC